MTNHKSVFTRIKDLISAVFVLYALLMLAYLIGRLTIGERFFLIETMNSLMPLIALPAVVVLIWALLRRQVRLFLLITPMMLFLITQYAVFFLPSHVDSSSEDYPVSVITHNLATRHNPSALEMILAYPADIIAVQEFSEPMAAFLSDGLSALYPYQALHPGDHFAVGAGIFSRYPIEADVYFDDVTFGAQLTHITLENGQIIAVLNAHPVPPQNATFIINSVRRSQEIQTLLTIAQEAAQTHPLIFLGDFNITDQNEDYHLISPHFSDAFRERGTGFGMTFARWNTTDLRRFLPPFIRIDYIFYSHHWASRDAYVVPNAGGSDHYAVYAELLLRE